MSITETRPQPTRTDPDSVGSCEYSVRFGVFFTENNVRSRAKNLTDIKILSSHD